ncbi:synaptic vesicular amine transporter [Halyomorpha halys]|uniref:synaptic vesicular amine transporter n=1 Tax=Halyomorpha halys TaxID=286706 RepID=UPI0006D52266
MCLVAEHYQDESQRSRIMGIVLGAVALGVLLGYPYGGFAYDFLGKMAPFLGISLFAILNIAFQLVFLNMQPPNYEVQSTSEGSSWKELMSDQLVMLTAGAIWLSSSAMAILEPCLPLWLMSHIKPQKWELGTVFIPDSIGYLVGTNCFGGIAYRYGRWRVAIAALILLAISACTLPMAKSMKGLIIPHVGLGLGIGVVDAALVPLLATLVDTKHRADYATVYAIQQTSVSLAYAFGPMFGGELVRVMGFPWLMVSIGIVNLLYSPLLVFLSNMEKQEVQAVMDTHKVSYKATESRKYNRFVASDESD